MAIRSVEYLQSLVRELAKLPDETEWVEFKCNNKQPQMIGEYISALSNSAALCERPKAYLVWGVDDATHKIVGTEFQYRKMKKGNEELEAWLSRMLSPRINFRFFEVPMDEGNVVLMEIPCAEKQPVQFAGGEYIRIGTNKKNLKEYPDKERELWRTFDSTPYELRIAMGNLDEDEISEYFTEHFKGDCLLAVGDDELIKIHFHTNEPWKVLEYCASLGEIYDIVVEDMDRQSRGLKG